MENEECEHTGLYKSMCAHCKGIPDRVKAGRFADCDAYTEAKFDSNCSLCRNRIREGDTIYLLDQVWVCGRCID